VCLSRPGGWAAQLEAEGLYAGCLDKRPGVDISCVSRLRRLIGDLSPDIVHTHLFTANFWTRVAGLGTRPWGLVATLHNVDTWRSSLHRTADRLLSGAADRYVAVGNEVGRYYLSEGIRATRLLVIPNAVDWNGREGQPPLQNPLATIRACGRLVPQKGFDVLVEAAGILAARGERFRLEIIGDGPERRRLETAIDRKGLAGRVFLTGERDDARDLVAACDIFVMPSLREGLPLVLLEALHAGRPIVATNLPALSGVVKDGREACLVKRGSPGALAAAVSRMLAERGWARALAAAGQRRARREYSIERAADSYIDIYRKVISERGLSGRHAGPAAPAAVTATAESPQLTQEMAGAAEPTSAGAASQVLCPSCGLAASVLVKSGLLPSNLAVYRCSRCGVDFFEGDGKDDYWATPGQSAIYEDESVAAERAQFFGAILERVAVLGCGGSLLDIGAGRGEFALSAMERGWRVSVVEPSREATAALPGKGVEEVFNSTFEAFEPSRRYDCVTLLDLVEHTRNPKAVIAKAAGCLAPGGVLVVLTPDGGSSLRVVARAAARVSGRFAGLVKYFYYLPHFSYLSARALSDFATAGGLKVKEMTHTATPRRFLMAKLKHHYGKYAGNALFCTVVRALYPAAKIFFANKLLAFAVKPLSPDKPAADETTPGRSARGARS
ncbi:MAG: glycosyltransferase, partial [Planctomycetes bacterium]|nr:glycosyltransferase [Planctomycetota bacterium]